jgi:putative transposase
MKALYDVVGISKQGFHQWLDRDLERLKEQQQLIIILRQLREDHKTLSCRKFYKMLKPRTLGRDQFEEFCYRHGFKVIIKKRRYQKTTDSRGVNRFPNLILSLDELTDINQLWVSDITYYELGNETYFLTFVLDVYNREIVGFSLSDNLLTENTTLKALEMAVKQRKPSKDSKLIIHSDGGGQYYARQFVKYTKGLRIRNSMGVSPYENPFAERINGTIKNDYLYPHQPKDLEELKKLLIKGVNLYNTVRPHDSLEGYTPHEFLNMVRLGLLTKTWFINKKKKVTKKEKVNISIN